MHDEEWRSVGQRLSRKRWTTCRERRGPSGRNNYAAVSSLWDFGSKAAELLRLASEPHGLAQREPEHHRTPPLRRGRGPEASELVQANSTDDEHDDSPCDQYGAAGEADGADCVIVVRTKIQKTLRFMVGQSPAAENGDW